jgi:hypothetical protein
MKRRDGLPTKPNKTSFLLAFKSEEDYDDFVSRCRFLGYDELIEFVENFKGKKKVDIKKEKNILLDFFKQQLLKNKELALRSKYNSNYLDTVANKKYEEYKKNLNDKIFLEHELKRTDYQEKLDLLNANEFVIECELDNVNGNKGLLTFAISHKILFEYFYEWLVYQTLN